MPAFAAFTEEGATWLGTTTFSARSASLADIDNDGDLDLYFQGGTSSARQIYLNNTIGAGTHTFTNVTSTWLSGITTTDSWSAAWGDYDSDGKVDIFLGQTNDESAPYTVFGRLLRNTGSAFVDVSNTTGFGTNHGFAQNVGWVDINNDHRLDMLIGMEGPVTKNEVFLQDASHVFTPVGAAVGFQQPRGDKAYGMAVGDTDGDGDLDVYISTCIGGGNIRNNFYKNMYVESGASHILSFVDIADTNGTQILDNTYGSEFVDFDNDGKLDLYVTGAQADPSPISNPTKIFKNMGNNQFNVVASFTAGVDLNGSKAIDYDNDGDLDLYFHDNLNDLGPAGTPNVRLFRNEGNWTFTDVTAAEGITNTGIRGYDGVWGDIDRDGDQDLINSNNATQSGSPTPERVYISDASTNGNHWLYVKLKGPDWDTTGIGASLYATLNDGTPQKVTLRREANTNPDTFNQSDLPVHFGLGSSLLVNRLLVRWPDGTAQVLNTIAGDQYVTVTYNPGDYNGDNVVDSRDFLVWRKGMGGDFTVNDYQVWRSRFGTIVAGTGTLDGGAVAEPATFTLLLVGIPLLVRRRR